MDLLDATVDQDELTRRAEELLGARRPSVARTLLAAAGRLAPLTPHMASLAARLDMREGHLPASLAVLGQAIAVTPRTDLFMLRADARRQLGDLTGAVSDAAEAVVHSRNDPAAKALLGVLMLELGRPEDAVRCLAEAVAAVPVNPSFREALANALTEAGRPEAAAATYIAGIVAAPGSLALRNAAILLAVRQRDFANAVTIAEAARSVGIANACTFGLKGHALASLGRHDEAAEAYADALKLGPEDPDIRRMVAVAGVPSDAARAPADYVREVFDVDAEHFERRLIGLRYRIPGVMRMAVMAHLQVAPGQAVSGERSVDDAVRGAGPVGATGVIGPVLDLGCGTGLAAVALADLPLGPFVGVDLAPRMLQQAAAKNLYAELHEQDIVAFLAGDTRHWQLILAADVVCYLGAIEPVLAAVHTSLRPGGLFIFSAEQLLGPHVGNGDWVLGRQGRYAHTAAYIDRASCAMGLVVRTIDAEVQRYDAGAPVPGFLIVLERPRDNG